MTQTFKVNHPNGHRLYFSESVISYSRNKVCNRSFNTGTWLHSLRTERLKNLRQYSVAILENRQEDYDHHLVDDVVQLAIIIAKLEGGYLIEESPEDVFNTVGGILLSSTIELMSREGFLKFEPPLSALPNSEISIHITDHGVQQLKNTTDKYFLAVYNLSKNKD